MSQNHEHSYLLIPSSDPAHGSHYVQCSGCRSWTSDARTVARVRRELEREERARAREAERVRRELERAAAPKRKKKSRRT